MWPWSTRAGLWKTGTADDVFNYMHHPYTEGLFDSLPNLKERGEDAGADPGADARPVEPAAGLLLCSQMSLCDGGCSEVGSGAESSRGSDTHFVACMLRDSGFQLEEEQEMAI